LSYWLFDARQRAALAKFASPHLLAQLTASISRGRRLLKRLLFITGVAFLFIALARPQWGFHWEEAHRKGIDILFAVDTSNSMLAQDVKPSRLARAKLAVNDLVNKLGGDRVGLIAFAGTAFLQSPLTLDYDAFLQTLDALDTKVIPEGGTDVAAAILTAEDTFGKEEKNVKIIVLITDGEDL
jgi:Ca-activated chloride channel family protein